MLMLKYSYLEHPGQVPLPHHFATVPRRINAIESRFSIGLVMATRFDSPIVTNSTSTVNFLDDNSSNLQLNI